MLPDSVAVVGALIGSLGGWYYLFATITGRAQPNRVTWLLWGTDSRTLSRPNPHESPSVEARPT